MEKPLLKPVWDSIDKIFRLQTKDESPKLHLPDTSSA